MDPIIPSSGDTDCLSESTPDPQHLDGVSADFQARDFARLIPVSTSAKKAFSQIAELAHQDKKWMQRERRFIHVERHLSSDGNRTGHYRFNLSIPPRRLGRGWILGCGQDSNSDSGIDLVLTLTGKKHDVRAQHAQIFHHPESTLLMLAPGPGKIVYLNGTELAGSGAKTVLPSTTFSITLGDLTYRFEFDTEAAVAYTVQLKQLMAERNAHSDYHPRSLDPTPRPNHFILRGYSFQSPLAGGAFGVVSACVQLNTARVFAAKRVQRTKWTRTSVNIELEIYQTLKSHPNVCTLEDKIYSDGDQYSMGSRELNDIYLIMKPWAPQTLDELLRDDLNVLLTPESTKFILQQVLLGLQHLHHAQVIHRDIKTSNILVVHTIPTVNIVIADMGAGTFELRSEDHTKGTILYHAPEILAIKYGWDYASEARHWSDRSDIYSAGLVGIQLRNKDRYRDFYRNLGGAQFVDDALNQKLKEELQRSLVVQGGVKAKDSRSTSHDLDQALLEMITWNVDYRPPASDVLQSYFGGESSKRAKSVGG